MNEHSQKTLPELLQDNPYFCTLLMENVKDYFEGKDKDEQQENR